MTQLVLVLAGKTPWDDQSRLVGSHSLPLTQESVAAMELLPPQLPAYQAVYCNKEDEASATAAQVLARRSQLRVRDEKRLAEPSLGLWEGLTIEQVSSRYEWQWEKWQDDPLTVTPPEGEVVEEFFKRVRAAVANIIKRSRDKTVLLVLRPLALQVAAGVAMGETDEQIGQHLHKQAGFLSIEVAENAAKDKS